MSNALNFIDDILKKQKAHSQAFPYEEILLTRLCLMTFSRLAENRNQFFKQHNINESLFMTLAIINSMDEKCIQPCELSRILSASKTHVTRIADDLIERGYLQRLKNPKDGRSQLLGLTQQGSTFLEMILPKQHGQLTKLWSALEPQEQVQLESIMRKLFNSLD